MIKNWIFTERIRKLGRQSFKRKISFLKIEHN